MEHGFMVMNEAQPCPHSSVTMHDPEPVLEAFKAYATRALRGAKLMPTKVKPWVRHGGTVYLWKEKDVAKAIEYVFWARGMICFGSATTSDHASGHALPNGRATAPCRRLYAGLVIK